MIGAFSVKDAISIDIVEQIDGCDDNIHASCFPGIIIDLVSYYFAALHLTVIVHGGCAEFKIYGWRRSIV